MDTVQEKDGKGYTKFHGIDVSKDNRAKELMGDRGKCGMALFEPCELGYACPVCNACDERLHWSEYRGFLWCEVCNLDIPSCLCVKYPEPNLTHKVLSKRDKILKATQVFLDSVQDSIGLHMPKETVKKQCLKDICVICDEQATILRTDEPDKDFDTVHVHLSCDKCNSVSVRRLINGEWF